jgi:hypothetical protein
MSHRFIQHVLISTLLLLAITERQLMAWGVQGHSIVAHIAELHLTDKAKAGIQQLLGPGGKISDAAVADWPDTIRDQRPETKPWHFVDIPYGAISYDPLRDCRGGQCVVEQTEHFARVLGDANATMVARAEALRFLVHFVGDLHQPLHCAERNGDRGGNRCKVAFLGQEGGNLHQIWDSSLVNQYQGGPDFLGYAERLSTRITPDQEKAWTRGSLVDWAWEAHLAALQHAYTGVPIQKTPVNIGVGYVTGNQRVVEEQLMKAGIRLAFLLNNTFH